MVDSCNILWPWDLSAWSTTLVWAPGTFVCIPILAKWLACGNTQQMFSRYMNDRVYFSFQNPIQLCFSSCLFWFSTSSYPDPPLVVSCAWDMYKVRRFHLRAILPIVSIAEIRKTICDCDAALMTFSLGKPGILSQWMKVKMSKGQSVYSGTFEYARFNILWLIRQKMRNRILFVFGNKY